MRPPAEQHEPEDRHEHDEQVGDERRGRRARVLEADGLQHVAEQQGGAGHRAVAQPRAGCDGRRRAISQSAAAAMRKRTARNGIGSTRSTAPCTTMNVLPKQIAATTSATSPRRGWSRRPSTADSVVAELCRRAVDGHPLLEGGGDRPGDRARPRPRRPRCRRAPLRAPAAGRAAPPRRRPRRSRRTASLGWIRRMLPVLLRPPPAARARAVGGRGRDAGADPRPAGADGGDRPGAHRADLRASTPFVVALSVLAVAAGRADLRLPVDALQDGVRARVRPAHHDLRAPHDAVVPVLRPGAVGPAHLARQQRHPLGAAVPHLHADREPEPRELRRRARRSC